MKIKEIVDFKIKEGDYFSHDDPEYSDWHKFARLQDLYDLVDDGGNYDKEEVEAEVKWLRKELDMHASERRGVSADTYKKGWSPHGHNARLENINEECGEGEYYCRKSGMCKPIPDGHTVTDDGTLVPTHMGYAEFEESLEYGIEESLSGPTRMTVQKHFDKEIGLMRTRINATEKALKIHDMKIDREGTVQSFKEDVVDEKFQPGFAVRYSLDGKRKVQAYKTQKDADHRAKILKSMGGVKDVSITKHDLNFKEEAPCWKGYKKLGMKKKNGKSVPNCVPEDINEKEIEEGDGIHHDCAKSFKHKKYGECTVIPGEHTLLEDGTVTHYDATFTGEDGNRYIVRNVAVANITDVISEGHVHASKSYKKKKMIKTEELEEAEYKGRKVKLNDPIRTSENPKKKFKVYVKNEKGNVVVVRFGDPDMEIKRDDPKRRKSFRARHNCANPGPKWKARYWSCYQWRAGKKVDEVATAGSTSAGNIAAVNNPQVTNPYRKGKKKHPKPVSVSALDDKTSSIFGGPIKRPM